MDIQSRFTKYKSYVARSMMMKQWVVFMVVFFSAVSVQSQWIIEPIQSYRESQSDSRFTKQYQALPLSLPFWDDFSKAKGSPDTSRWEIGRDIFINNTMGPNAPTQGIATFDGLRFNGQAHNISASFNGAGDSLVSKPIDLSTISSFNQNTVYLSFYWQVKGNGEIPDDRDSIRLQLLAKIDTNLVWTTVWKQLGGIENVKERFTFEDIQINHSKYFHEDFRFRFQSFSSLQGPFDTWNIDYVYLNENRVQDDSVVVDHSVTGSPGPLFGSYYQITASAFFNDPESILAQQSVLISNLDSKIQPADVRYTIVNENTKEVYLNYQLDSVAFLNPGEIKLANGPDPTEVSLNIPPFDGDSLVITSQFLYSSGDSLIFEVNSDNDTIYYPVNLRVNDTLRSEYTLHNYYAYDDGSGEFALGINSNRGQVAIRYVLMEPDTLTHVDIYFPNIAPNATGKSVDIIAWRNLSENGELVRVPHTIHAPQYPNQFTRIKLTRPLIVSDTIYVGFQQFIDNYIGVGFDRNNAFGSSNIFLNVEGRWEQNTSHSGALMIRPVFADAGVIVLSNKASPKKPGFFPNPTDGSISFYEEMEEVTVMDLMGRKLHSARNQTTLDLHFLQDGIYLLRINNKNNISTQKIIIRK